MSERTEPAWNDLDRTLAAIRAGDREAAARFLDQVAPLLRRRLRRKLGNPLRRLFDSQDLMATVARRFDRYVATSDIRAEHPAQLFTLVQRIADAAVSDKARIAARIRASELPGADPAHLARDAETGPDERGPSISEVIDAVPDAIDREILSLWMTGRTHEVIASVLGMEPAAVRKRWQRLRERLRERFGVEEDDA